MSIELYCNDPLKQGCHWSGSQQELVCAEDDPNPKVFNLCPHCGGKDFHEEEVEE